MKRCALFVAILLLATSPTGALAAGECGYYINRAGHEVPRPCGDWHRDARPQGATSRCRDGTWSYSEHPNAPGTCSHHGGRQ